MPHTACDTEESVFIAAVDILGIRSHPDTGIENRCQIAQFGAGIVAGDLRSGDDHHLADPSRAVRRPSDSRSIRPPVRIPSLPVHSSPAPKGVITPYPLAEYPWAATAPRVHRRERR